MGAEDDFALWERELEPRPADVEEAGGGRGLMVAAALTAAGCATLILSGQVPLGAAGLLLTLMILLLWRAGL